MAKSIRPPGPRHIGRILRGAGFAALGFALLAGASWLGVPPLVKHLAQQQIAQQLGRKATLANVSFNPLTLTLIASGFALYEANGTTVAFSANTLLVNASIASLVKLAPVLQQVTLSGPKLHVMRSSAADGGRSNFSDVIERLLAQPKSEGEARFSVSNIELVDGSILFDDRVTDKQVTIAALTLGLPHVSNFDSALDLFVQPRLSMSVNGAPFALKGRSKPFASSQETALAIDIEQLDVASYAGFAPLPVMVEGGKLSTRLDLSFVRKQGKPEINLSGDIKLQDVALADSNAAPLFKAALIATHIDNFNLLSGSAAIGKIDLQGPAVWAALDVDGRLNGAALAGSKPAPAAASVQQAQVPARLFTLAQLTINDGKVMLTRLNAQPDGAKAAANAADYGSVQVKEISLTNASVDTAKRTFAAAALKVAGMHADVRRDASGDINLAQLINPPSGKSNGTAISSTTSSAADAAWVAKLGSVAVTGSSVAFVDQSVAPQVNLRADALSLTLGKVSSKLDKPISITLSGTLSSTLNQRGNLTITGSAAPQLASLDLAIDANALPVAALQPYFADLLNATLKTGGADAKGQLRLSLPTGKKALAARYNGALGLTNFRVIDKENSADFLRWKTLAISAIDAGIDGERQHINLGKIELDDFYARAILSPAGTLNLDDILVSRAGNKSVVPIVPIVPESSGPKPVPESKPTALAVAAKADKDAIKPVIRIGQVLLKNGNINFTDNFVKPNYTANMTGMHGSVGAIASNRPAPAPIELKGKIDDDAPVAISGSLNLLFEPMFLDIKASASDVELPRLTPYAAKYAGYEIVKGKLAMEVNYNIENRLLSAQNRVRIDQLTFGDQIDSPSATRLPVRLAVALLKDRDGRIDIDLPISGSLDDPQFSIGGVLMRVFVNLISKAVTAPFALLASDFGGGEELGHAEFQPGSALLTKATKSRLDTLAKALLDRPALKLDIIGRVDPALDEPGLRQQALNRKLAGLQRAADRRTGRTEDADQREANTANVAEAGSSAADHARDLEKIYESAQFDKPRNVIGFARSLPAADMEQLILAHTKVTPDDLRALADQRAQATRNYLKNTGKIALQRIFLIAPQLSADGINDKGATSRVDFALR